jgi:hypothetical protein
MADIRIKDLATTATSAASDDYLALDGSANGTRKLSAYSPTFGGNLTVGGTAAINGLLTVTDATGIKVVNSTAPAVSLWKDSTPTKAAQLYYDVSLSTLKLGVYNGSSWTYGLSLSEAGNLTVSGTGGVQLNSVANLTWGGPYGANIPTIASPTGTSLAFYPAGSTSGESARFTSTGSLLLGTTTDSGNGKLQLATHTTSAGGIGFGTDTSLYRGAIGGFLYLDGVYPLLGLAVNGTRKAYVYFNGTNVIINSEQAASSLVFQSSNTIALTLDSSQRCILAGALRLNNAYVSGAPTATGYVTLQDSAGNTYKVLVGT